MAQARKPASVDRPLPVGDRTYTLRFSIRAMAALQDHYELPSLDAVGKKLQDTKNMSVQDMTAILWAGLQTHHREEVDMDTALDILDELGVDGMQVALGDAMNAGMPPGGEGGADGARPPKPGRSTSSTKTPRNSGSRRAT